MSNVVDECSICQHAKIQAINDAIDSGRYVGVIARQYRLDLPDLDKHREHRRPTHGQRGVYTFSGVAGEPGEGSPDQVLTDYPGKIQKTWKEFQPNIVPQVTENPESQFKQAWQLAKDDDRMRARMVAWLNDQLQADDMGL